jgi:predicted TIM-barrel fold metal-dependent hydrolase
VPSPPGGAQNIPKPGTFRRFQSLRPSDHRRLIEAISSSGGIIPADRFRNAEGYRAPSAHHTFSHEWVFWPYEALRFWGNIDAGTALIDRHPDARFIIDHMGIRQPSVPPAPPHPWADLPKVVKLAKRKNAVIKITGACTLSQEPYPFPDIWDPLARIFDAWGFERCLWGTDWTRTFAVVSYEQAVEPFLKTDRLSDTERAMLMGGACAKAYGWSPKKA